MSNKVKPQTTLRDTGDLTGCSLRTGDHGYSGNGEFDLSIGGPIVCLKEEEWDICEEGLGNTGSDCLLFQREVEVFQEKEMKRENEEEKKNDVKFKIILFITIVLSILLISSAILVNVIMFFVTLALSLLFLLFIKWLKKTI